MIRAILGAIIALALLYMAYQEFANGRYTQATTKMASQIRYSMGF